MNEHPWTNSYPAGVRWDADLPKTPVGKLAKKDLIESERLRRAATG